MRCLSFLLRLAFNKSLVTLPPDRRPSIFFGRRASDRFLSTTFLVTFFCRRPHNQLGFCRLSGVLAGAVGLHLIEKFLRFNISKSVAKVTFLPLAFLGFLVFEVIRGFLRRRGIAIHRGEDRADQGKNGP